MTKKNPMKSAVDKTSTPTDHSDTLKKMRDEARLNVNMDRELYNTFKTMCLAQDVSITDVITELVEGYVSQNPVSDSVKKLRKDIRQG